MVFQEAGVEVREGRESDLPRLLEIYNHYVEHSHVTFDTTPKTPVQRLAWFADFRREGPYRLFVVETGGTVQGYASSRVFRARPAYDRSVESSVYLAAESSGMGLGSALYERLLNVLREEQSVHRVYGGVAIPNESSVALHQRFGFKQAATFSEVGFKFGRYWDVVWFERGV
jgi:phosphinothricin acetyltransferase